MKIDELQPNESRLKKGWDLQNSIKEVMRDKEIIKSNGAIILIPDRNNTRGGAVFELPKDFMDLINAKIIDLMNKKIESLKIEFDKL